MVNTMVTEVVTARLPLNDTELIKHFVSSGEFKSKSDFFRFAVKHALAELIQKELDTRIITKKIDKKELNRIHELIKKVRDETWREKYADSIS